MMKHLLTIVLCLTTLTGLAQEEKIKKSEWWDRHPTNGVNKPGKNFTRRRPLQQKRGTKTTQANPLLH